VTPPLVVLSGATFLAGTPAVLVAGGFSPRATVADLAAARVPFNAGGIVGGSVVAVVWIAWAWFAVGTLAAVAARLGGRSPQAATVSAAGAPSVFVAAVWACIAVPVGGGRIHEAPAPPVPVAARGPVEIPVVIASTVTGAAAVIGAVGRARNARLAAADLDAVVSPLSRAASLHLTAALASADGGARHAGLDVSGAMQFAGDWVVAGPTPAGEAPAVPHDDVTAGLIVEASRPLVPATWRERTAGRPTFVVRVLGPVEVENAAGVPVTLPRGRSLELLAWLVTHRDRPTRSAARTAMWDAEVQGATFNNVVSDLRRSLGTSDGRLVLDRSPDDRFRLASSVVSDAELLESALVRFRRSPDDGDELRTALSRVRDLPFAGSGYLWPDTEGITSSMVLLVVRASEALARAALDHGDIDDVFWATGRGLSVLRNHEGLVELRMRAHASRGDSSAVTEEWRSYERVARREGDVRAGPSRMSALRDELVG
jgi:DNA-binding SARP family transcriptional activator